MTHRFSSRARAGRAVIAVLLSSSLAACGLPNDQRGEIDKIEQAQEIRAGVVGDPEAFDSERQWLGEIAQEMNVGLTFKAGETHQMVEALRKGEIDVLIGLPAKTPFKKELGMSRPYVNAKLSPQKRALAVRPGANGWLYRLDGAIIAHGKEPTS